MLYHIVLLRRVGRRQLPTDPLLDAVLGELDGGELAIAITLERAASSLSQPL
jgi:hypothetical protein